MGIGDVQQYLEGIDFPAQKEEVASGAENNGAPKALRRPDKERGDEAVQRPSRGAADDKG